MSIAFGSSAIPRRPSRLRRLLGWAAFVAVLAVLGLAATASLRPGFLGISYSHVIVAGDSMLPTLEDGDLVITRRQTAYERGDIVAYRVPLEGERGPLVIHRIVAGNAVTGYLFRGDNRKTRDPWQVDPASVLGESAVRIPRLGHAFVFLREPLGFAAVAAALFFFVVVNKASERPRQITPGR